MTENVLISFLCDHCHTEIEASPDMIGLDTECPACGAKLIVPDSREDGVMRYSADDFDPNRTHAMKSRTIRIELSDL